MPDSREIAKRKANGQPLPNAPKPREQGQGSPRGHVGQYEGRTVTLSDHATRHMPGGRRNAVLGSKNG